MPEKTAKKVKTTLALDSIKKGSVRYSTKDKTKEAVLITIYVLNAAVEKLSNPKEIEVSILAIK